MASNDTRQIDRKTPRIDFGHDDIAHLNIADVLTHTDVIDIPRTRRWTWLLSGGGAKGSFQVGALLYLGDNLSEYRPRAICGTSVGAINAILPSEGTSDSVRRLRDMWLALENESDMYLVTDEAEQIESSLVAGLLDLTLAQVASLVLSEPPSGIETLDPRQAPITAQGKARRMDGRVKTWGWLPFAGWRIAKHLKKKLNKFEDLLDRTRSLYSLDPLSRKLDENVDVDRLQARPEIALRLVSVALESGRPCFVDKLGRFAEVVSQAGHARYYPLPGDTKGNIVQGALASAAIPGAFPPVVFAWGSRFELGRGLADLPWRTCVDGGVRDYLPVREAVDLVDKAHPLFDPGVIAILNSKPFESRLAPVSISELGISILPEPEIELYHDAPILDLAGRAISILRNEVNRTDLLEALIQDSEIPRHTIFPDYQITSTAQVDPGLVRINMAYGWMTAYETLNRTRFGDEAWRDLRANANEIALIRLATWAEEHRFADLRDVEELVASAWYYLLRGPWLRSFLRISISREEELDKLARAFGFDDLSDLERYVRNAPEEVPNVVRRLRQLKRILFERIRRRIDTWGEESLPSVETIGEHYSNWWLHWERHQTDSDPIEHGMATPWEAAFGTRLFGRDIPPVPAESPPSF